MIIVRQVKHGGVYLTLYTPLLCVWRSLFEIWLSDGVYLNIATNFDTLRFRLGILHNCSLKGGKRTILERINNAAFA